MNVYVGTKLRRKSDGLICECVSLIRDGMIEVRHGKNGALLTGGQSLLPNTSYFNVELFEVLK